MLAALAGCAMQKPMEPDVAAGFRKVGFVIFTSDERPVVLDNTGSVGPKQAGALFSVLDYAVTRNTLGGNVDDIRRRVPTCPLRQMLEKGLSEKLSERYQLIGPQLLSAEMSGPDPTGKDGLNRLLSVSRKHALDALLVVECGYGLAVYPGESSIVAIEARVKVYDVRTGETICHTRISSGEFFREPRTLQQLTADEGALFKKDVADAANTLSSMIASQLGLEKDLTEKSPYKTISEFEASCSNPYSIEQDCSFIFGATREINIDGCIMRAAGSNNGKYILLMGCSSLLTNVDTTRNTLADNTKSIPYDYCLNSVREKLAQGNLQILTTTRILDGTVIIGYFLELNGNGYPVLKQFSYWK